MKCNMATIINTVQKVKSQIFKVNIIIIPVNELVYGQPRGDGLFHRKILPGRAWIISSATFRPEPVTGSILGRIYVTRF